MTYYKPRSDDTNRNKPLGLFKTFIKLYGVMCRADAAYVVLMKDRQGNYTIEEQAALHIVRDLK